MKSKLILLCLIFFTSIQFSKNYYVNPSSGNMKNNGTNDAPWSSLDSVISSKSSIFIGGDTLFLYSGYHGEKVIINTNPTTKIVIIAVKDNNPKLLSISLNGSNWVLENLTFTQEGNDGIGIPSQFSNGVHLILGVNSKKNTIQNCTFYSTANASGWTLSDWRTKVWSGIIDYGKNNLIRKNYLFNIAYAIQLMQECDSSKVLKNVIENFSGDGIRIGGADYCLIENNIIKNSIELDANPSDGNHEDGIQAWDFGDGVNGLIVRGNLIINYEDINKPFKGIMQGMGFFDGFYNDCVIENNIIIVEHWHGISLYGAKNCRIINNTVLPNPGGSKNAGPPWIGIFPHKDGRNSTGNIVRNNLSTNLSLDFGSSIEDHNIVDAQAFDFCENYTNLNFYPKPDFTINGKKIVDSGSSELAPIIDFNGTQRPKGNSFDIGAYEYWDSLTSINNYLVNNINNHITLYQNYPNPFNGETTISYSIPQSTFVTIKIYDVLGKEIKTLFQENINSGYHTLVYNSENITSGVYIFQLQTENFSEIKKMIFSEIMFLYKKLHLK